MTVSDAVPSIQVLETGVSPQQLKYSAGNARSEIQTSCVAYNNLRGLSEDHKLHWTQKKKKSKQSFTISQISMCIYTCSFINVEVDRFHDYKLDLCGAVKLYNQQRAYREVSGDQRMH